MEKVRHPQIFYSGKNEGEQEYFRKLAIRNGFEPIVFKSPTEALEVLLGDGGNILGGLVSLKGTYGVENGVSIKNGFELASGLEDEKYKGVLIACSSDSQITYEDCVLSGFDDFVKKPMTLSDFENLLGKYFMREAFIVEDDAYMGKLVCELGKEVHLNVNHFESCEGVEEYLKTRGKVNIFGLVDSVFYMDVKSDFLCKLMKKRGINVPLVGFTGTMPKQEIVDRIGMLEVMVKGEQNPETFLKDFMLRQGFLYNSQTR